MARFVVTSTDIGLRKKVNQDSLYSVIAKAEGDNMTFAVMCDGLGGLSYGEVASAQTVVYFKEWFQKTMPLIIEKGFSWDIVEEQWKTIINKVDSVIREMAEEYGANMGTTLTAGLFYRGQYMLVQIGDSRCYEINAMEINQLTTDQTVVAREVQLGYITKEQAMTDIRNRVLLQCIGYGKELDIEFVRGDIKEQTNYVVCSDGFYKKQSDEEIQRGLCYYQNQTTQQVDSMVKNMIETCKSRGEGDNISCIVLLA